MQLPVTRMGDNGGMQSEQDPISRHSGDDSPQDDTRKLSDGVDSSSRLASESVEPDGTVPDGDHTVGATELEDGDAQGADHAEVTVEAALEELAAVDPVDAPPIAESIATRLRSDLSDR